MNWDAIGTFAEIIGAAGVILSLVYVGKQLRQTNSMSRSSVHLARSEAMANFAMNIACAPHLFEALTKVHFHDLVRDDATEEERMQLGYIYVAVVCQLHMGFEHWKEGILSKSDLEEYIGPAASIMSFPYLPSVWPFLKLGYPVDFQRWFEVRYNLADGATTAAVES